MKPRIIDTVYLVAYLTPSDRLHSAAVKLLEKELGELVRVSEAALMELDLIMKSRGYTAEERERTWLYLTAVLGGNVEPLLPIDFAVAARLEAVEGLDCFDALVAAQCINRGAEPVTTDQEVVAAVKSARAGRRG